MFVRDRMSSPAITVRPETSFQEAMRILREKRFRRLPVVDSAGQLIGIVSERDLLHASPSPATSLSIWEINYLLWQLRVDQLMTTRVLTAEPDMPIEDAARLMVEHRIGGLPVVDSAGAVVGVITETDIFRAFTELFGAHESGVRAVVSQGAGGLHTGELVTALERAGGTVKSLSTFTDQAASAHGKLMTLRISGMDEAEVRAILAQSGHAVQDVRTTTLVAAAHPLDAD